MTGNWISGSKTILSTVCLTAGDSQDVQQNGGLVKPSIEMSSTTFSFTRRRTETLFYVNKEDIKVMSWSYYDLEKLLYG
jgi:hypothetical protein